MQQPATPDDESDRRRFVPVAERSGTYQGTDGTNDEPQWVRTAGRYGRTVHRVLNPGAETLRLVFHNWVSLPAAAEAANTDDITVRCAVEYPAGVWRRVNGSTAYSGEVRYRRGDQVTDSGDAWVCVRGTGQRPNERSRHWERVVRYPVTFRGEDRDGIVTVPMGGDVTSRRVRLRRPLEMGTRIAVRTQMNAAGGTIPPCDDIGDWDFAVDYPDAAPATDLVHTWETTETPMPVATGSTDPPGTPVTPSWDNPANKLPRPGVLLGDGRHRRWTALLGDSLVQGYLDTFLGVDSYRDGFAVRAFQAAGRYLWRRSCQGGAGWDYFTPELAPRQYALAARAPAVFVDLGGNDINRGRTFVELQDSAITGWRALARRGARVWQSTVIPRSNSSDNWRTAANQTSGAVPGDPSARPVVHAQQPVPPGYLPGGTRDEWNAWLRAGAPIDRSYAAATNDSPGALRAGHPRHPLAGVVDISVAVEDRDNTSFWRTNGSIPNLYTMEGAHPSPTGYAVLGREMRAYVPDFTRRRAP